VKACLHGVSLLCKLLKNAKRESWCQCHLADQQIPQVAGEVDADVAEKVRQGGCLHCAGKLHSAKYRRKATRNPSRTGSETKRFIALVFVAIRTAAANGTPRLRSGSWGAKFTGALWWCWWRRCSMGSRRHGCTLAPGPGRGSAHAGTLAGVVVAHFLSKPLLEHSRARFSPPIDLKPCRCRSVKLLGWRSGGDRLLALLQFLSPDHHRFNSLGVVYVREALWPAQDAGRHRTEGWW